MWYFVEIEWFTDCCLASGNSNEYALGSVWITQANTSSPKWPVFILIRHSWPKLCNIQEIQIMKFFPRVPEIGKNVLFEGPTPTAFNYPIFIELLALISALRLSISPRGCLPRVISYQRLALLSVIDGVVDVVWWIHLQTIADREALYWKRRQSKTLIGRVFSSIVQWTRCHLTSGNDGLTVDGNMMSWISWHTNNSKSLTVMLSAAVELRCRLANLRLIDDTIAYTEIVNLIVNWPIQHR